MLFGLPSIMVIRRKYFNLSLGLLLAFIFETHGQFQDPLVGKSCAILNNSHVVRTVPECDHETFCEYTPNYPTEIVKRVLEENPHLRYYATVDEMQELLETEIPDTSDDEPDDEELCVSAERMIFPKAGKAKDSKWMYIINHEDVVQSVRIETCVEQEKPCRVIEGFAEGYVTKCKQKYIYRQLLAITENGAMNRYSFQFPASCCCHIEFQGDRYLKTMNDD